LIKIQGLSRNGAATGVGVNGAGMVRLILLQCNINVGR
jgi:hypothetical protein